MIRFKPGHSLLKAKTVSTKSHKTHEKVACFVTFGVISWIVVCHQKNFRMSDLDPVPADAFDFEFC